VASNARTNDPPFTGKFVFEVNGLTIGAFTEVSGLSVQIEVEEVVEGGQNQATLKLPGRMKWPNLVLKRGITDTDNLFEWVTATSGEGFAEHNKVARRDGKITVLDPHSNPVRTWEFTGAMPVRWSGPRLVASSRELATEELEVCHSGFRSSG
jgi:phage tail-like protein